VVSVGAAGAERQVINVAPGAINATSTDAINGSQLYMASDALNKKTDVLGSTVATTIGGGTTYNPITGTVEGSIDVGGNTYTTVQEALDATGHNITTSSVGTGVVNNTSVSKIGSGDTVTYTAGNNIVITQSDKEVQIATSMTPVFTSVTSDTLTVNDSTTLNGGTTVNNSFTVGAGTTVNMGGNVITNVAAGVDMTDAVNVSQLVSSLAAVKTEVVAGTNIAGVVKSTGVDGHDIYTVNAQGTSTSAGSSAVTVVGTPGANNVTDYAVDLSAATKASLVNADSAVQTVVTQINGTTVKTIDKTNNTANFVTGDNIVLTDDGAGGIKIGTSLTPTFTSVTSSTPLSKNRQRGNDTQPLSPPSNACSTSCKCVLSSSSTAIFIESHPCVFFNDAVLALTAKKQAGLQARSDILTHAAQFMELCGRGMMACVLLLTCRHSQTLQCGGLASSMRRPQAWPNHCKTRQAVTRPCHWCG
jgi:hypothetical protein